MFNLDNTMRYWLYNKPVNMRLGFNGLSGIVANYMNMNPRSGDVFIFINTARNRIKILHREEYGLVLYALRVEIGKLSVPFFEENEENSSYLDHKQLMMIAKSAMESSYVRRMKMLSKNL